MRLVPVLPGARLYHQGHREVHRLGGVFHDLFDQHYRVVGLRLGNFKDQLIVDLEEHFGAELGTL